MDLASVNKQAKDKNGVKYLPVRQDLFDRTVEAKGMKIKDSKETVRAFLTMITKTNRPKKRVYKGTEIAGDFEEICKAERIQIYSTISETKDAFAEGTIRSRKDILYRYLEDYGYNYVHKLSQFITNLNSGKNCQINLITKTVKNSEFLSILYSKPLRVYEKTKFRIRDRICISKYDLLFRKCY